MRRSRQVARAIALGGVVAGCAACSAAVGTEDLRRDDAGTLDASFRGTSRGSSASSEVTGTVSWTIRTTGAGSTVAPHSSTVIAHTSGEPTTTTTTSTARTGASSSRVFTSTVSSSRGETDAGIRDAHRPDVVAEDAHPSTASAQSVTTGRFSSAASSSAAPPTCANPPSDPPIGFAPPTGVLGTGCTSAEVQAYAACQIAPATNSDPGCFNPLTEGAPDGSFNACGQCAEGTVIQPGMNTSSEWGLFLNVAIEPSVGDTQDIWELSLGPEVGACVVAAGGAAGRECGLDLMALDDCEFSTCIPLCPIPNPGAGTLDQTAVTALVSCLQATQTGACASYLAAETASCGPYGNTAKGKLVTQKCNLLVDQVFNTVQNSPGGMLQEPEAGAPTMTGYEQLVELVCGGGDAGF